MRKSAAAALAIGLLTAPTLAASQPAQPPVKATRMGFRVASEDAALAARFDKAVRAALADKPGYIIVDNARSAEFIVYANRDVNDRVNPKGISVAVALVSNAPTYHVAAKLLPNGPGAITDPQVRDELAQMVRQVGFLQGLNVIHMDADSDANIEVVAKAIVTDFLGKVPPDLGG